jgi:purine-binding chemotaxis protein CheW
MSANSIEARNNDSRQVLSFTLGTELYGVDILRVQEIRSWSAVTRIPKAPPHHLGVLNLRGSIVPIVDLRLRFGLEYVEFTPLTAIIVLAVESSHGRRELGIVVDSVSDVVGIDSSNFKAVPSMGGGENTDFVQHLVTFADRLLILLDTDALIEPGSLPYKTVTGTGVA